MITDFTVEVAYIKLKWTIICGRIWNQYIAIKETTRPDTRGRGCSVSRVRPLPSRPRLRLRPLGLEVNLTSLYIYQTT